MSPTKGDMYIAGLMLTTLRAVTLWYVYVEGAPLSIYIGGTPPEGHSHLIVTCCMGGGTYPPSGGECIQQDMVQVPCAEHMY